MQPHARARDVGGQVPDVGDLLQGDAERRGEPLEGCPVRFAQADVDRRDEAVDVGRQPGAPEVCEMVRRGMPKGTLVRAPTANPDRLRAASVSGASGYATRVLRTSPKAASTAVSRRSAAWPPSAASTPVTTSAAESVSILARR